jgi:glutamine amidotransferase
MAQAHVERNAHVPWLAYTRSPVRLTDVLCTSVHSMIGQSLHSKLGAERTNGDGFGVGWYEDTAVPRRFRSIEPTWNDQNLRELTGYARFPLFFAHIRAAIGSPMQQAAGARRAETAKIG